ncbi:hypothetical protein U6A24_04375 [Aquimarina gracilis]|uniref:Uncharacterized protein n=1 Tax=Aquimarina gracilis TaxID=874422 RepID=A0ABU5ZRL9_9FLAO|nr:hypothetical protein [Aquimarina gracilis]MEB3344683.1 hypothetical protein [Aquimarina gracilis]
MKKISLINLSLIVIIGVYLIKKDDIKQSTFEEITAERLNIVGKNGNKYVVISNPEKQASPSENNKSLKHYRQSREPGLVFFNSEGDEVGGLIFDADSTNSYQYFTFDQYKGDQVMYLAKDETLVDGNWKRWYGLIFNERSNKPQKKILEEYQKIIQSNLDSTELKKQLKEFWSYEKGNREMNRMFVGRETNGEIGIFLTDRTEKPRLHIYVDSLGTPFIKTFDQQGNATNILKTRKE